MPEDRDQISAAESSSTDILVCDLEFEYYLIFDACYLEFNHK